MANRGRPGGWDVLLFIAEEGVTTRVRLGDKFDRVPSSQMDEDIDALFERKAIWCSPDKQIISSLLVHPPVGVFTDDLKRDAEDKLRVARHIVDGAQLIEKHDRVFLGTGSTIAYVAACLGLNTGLCEDIELISNSPIVFGMLQRKVYRLCVVGGHAERTGSLEIHKEFPLDAVLQHRPTKCFLEAEGLSEEGLWCDPRLVILQQKLIELSPKIFILAEHSKVGAPTSGAAVFLDLATLKNYKKNKKKVTIVLPRPSAKLSEWYGKACTVVDLSGSADSGTSG